MDFHETWLNDAVFVREEPDTSMKSCCKDIRPECVLFGADPEKKTTPHFVICNPRVKCSCPMFQAFL